MTAAYLVFEQLMTLRRGEIVPAGVGEKFRELLAQGKVGEAEALCREKPCLLSFVLLSGLAEVEGGWAAVEKALEILLQDAGAHFDPELAQLFVAMKRNGIGYKALTKPMPNTQIPERVHGQAVWIMDHLIAVNAPARSKRKNALQCSSTPSMCANTASVRLSLEIAPSSNALEAS